MAQGGDIYQETIFVQTDPAFDIVLHALKELREENRSQATYCKIASIENIESNDESDDRRFMFGGIGATAKVAFLMFGRTASAVVRMCMLEAANVPPDLWPTMGSNSQRRNRGKLNSLVLRQRQPDFRLANNEYSARDYWRRYDQLYPHFLIEHEVREVGTNPNNVSASIPRMMLIFKENFSEVVVLNTTFTATPRGEGQFDSYIHVTCIVQEIINEGEDGEFTQRLKALMLPQQLKHGIQDEYFKKIKNVEKEEDLDGLPYAFDFLKIEDKIE